MDTSTTNANNPYSIQRIDSGSIEEFWLWKMLKVDLLQVDYGLPSSGRWYTVRFDEKIFGGKKEFLKNHKTVVFTGEMMI